MRSDPAPAMPPEAMLMAKNFQKSVLGLCEGKRFLIVSLNAKLKACVGKYLHHNGQLRQGRMRQTAGEHTTSKTVTDKKLSDGSHTDQQQPCPSSGNQI